LGAAGFGSPGLPRQSRSDGGIALRRGNTINVFAEHRLSDYLAEGQAALERDIRSEPRDKLLGMNEAQYVDYLVGQHQVQNIQMDISSVTISDREEMIPADRFPQRFFMSGSGAFPKQVISYHIPFDGDEKLLTMSASHFLMWTHEVECRGGTITFDLINFSDDSDAVVREAQGIMSKIQQQANNVRGEVEQYNNGLRAKAEELVRKRRAELLKQANMLEKLGVPFRKTAGVPETFTVPVKKTEPIVGKPAAPDSPYSPEPCLDDETYEAILKICFDAAREIERHPSIYVGKDEETLRDHLLMVLSPHFQSATGETFNKRGKTDILIRHEGNNVFIAECKFWNGQKAYFAAIDQALRYLTWRDSKAALVIFVKNKEIGPILKQVEEGTDSHGSCVRALGQVREGWYSFRFHLPDDESREVRLAVLCFHFPDMD
jgi:hypothetical protein